jgi:hypothetical protein
VKRDGDAATLRMFVAVCEEGSIACAAEREAVVASAVSKATGIANPACARSRSIVARS